MDATQYIKDLGLAARGAAMELTVATGAQRDAALRACAAAIRRRRPDIQTANEKDIARSDEFGLSRAMVDRLRLDGAAIEGMAVALEQIAAQDDPVGRTISVADRPGGLRVEKRRVPIGVVGIIYESRPNVTADAGGLCLKSANACILRGGKEAMNSNLAIAAAMREAIASVQLPAAALSMIDNPDHEIVTAMAKAEGLIDVIIPRGGERLIRAVVSAATIPVIKHFAGNCHVYVHSQADLEMAQRIAMNAKCQRPGTCNAMETLLVDRAVAQRFLPAVAAQLQEAGVELRGDEAVCRLVRGAKPADEADWSCEYLDLILAVKVVDGLDAAIAHINKYGSRHTDAIVTESPAVTEKFIAQVDSSSVMVNASTRLADGGVYGLGAEVGISTDKLHARGPMGAEDLTTYKWIVTGRGNLRE